MITRGPLGETNLLAILDSISRWFSNGFPIVGPWRANQLMVLKLPLVYLIIRPFENAVGAEFRLHIELEPASVQYISILPDHGWFLRCQRTHFSSPSSRATFGLQLKSRLALEISTQVLFMSAS